MVKRLLIVILALIMLVSTAGCGNNTAATNGEPATASKTDTITITDHTGKEVTIPANISRVAIDQVPLAASYVMFKGGTAENLIGLSGNVLATISRTALVEIAPEILNVSTDHYENGELNVEELMKLKPDVVLYNAGNTKHGELFAQAGIPAVGFNTNGDPTELYADWLRLLEEVFQEKGKMDDIIAHGDEMIAMVKERTAKIEDNKRVNTLILFNVKDGVISVSGGERHFGYLWLKAINAKNAAEEVVGVTQVNLEQIYGWQPDAIVMPGPGQCSISPSEVIANTVEGADFSPLKAVQEKKVYTCDLGMWSWYIPSSDAPLVTLWMAQQIYPDLFKDIDLKSETLKYYKAGYNYDLSPAQLDYIFNPEK